MRDGIWTGQVFWLHGDHLGSASLMTDGGGNEVGQVRYKPFGEKRSEWNAYFSDRKFTGQREETSIGLYDYGARFYSPMLGRFISADSIVQAPSDPQSLNRFSYTRGNPLKYIDPSGHFWTDAFRYEGAILSASAETGVPALAIAAAIGAQTNGKWYDFIARFFGANQTLGPGQVNVGSASQQLGRSVTQDELMASSGETSIRVRAMVMADTDQAFLSTCGSKCTATHLTQDRWLVFALSQNDIGLDFAAAWNGGDFNWDMQFERFDIEAGTKGSRDAGAYIFEQGFRSRERFLLGQFADYLESLDQWGFGDGKRMQNLPVLYPERRRPVSSETQTASRFLRCMSQTGASTGGCR